MSETISVSERPLRADGGGPVLGDLHRRHREQLLQALGEGQMALLFSAPTHLRNGDADYRYRQDSDVLYFSGWREPDCVLVFRPGADEPFSMFVQPRDPERETWTGRREGPEGAMERYGADQAWSIEELERRLPDLLLGYHTLHYRFTENAERDRMLFGAIGKAKKKARKSNVDVPDAFIDPGRVIHELRLFKSTEELELLREAGRITGEGHRAAMKATRPGAYEFELEAAIEGTFRKLGGQGPGYTSIVGGGVNATILHYHTNEDLLKEGELVCVDAGCERDGYTADVTRTWPVNGKFSDIQAKVYQIVLDAQREAIAACVVGQTFQGVHEVASRVLTQGMMQLGLLDGDPADEAAVNAHLTAERQKRWYMHGTSHWLGLDVHDVGLYRRGGASRRLEPGMVLTVEPGLYIAQDDESAPEVLRGIGIRIEDDIAVTDGLPLNLTDGIPKEIADIESWMAENREG